MAEEHAPVDALPSLDTTEQRLLGALMEKELTVPAAYPMTVNSVRLACNQTSSREPVVDYDDRLVHETLRALKQRDLVRVVWQDTGKRTMKYLQLLVELLDLDPSQRALVTVLLLRGAQPAGALKTRTERLHPFTDRAEVEACLQAMAVADPPLVRELERQRGQQDARWVHLLGPVDLGDVAGPASAAPAVERDAVIGDGGEARDERVRATYDAVAQAYAADLTSELDGLPFERWLLDRTVELAGYAPIVEVGCGPGHVTAYLASSGAEARGIDLTPAMVEEARRRYPEGDYDLGDLRTLMRPTSASGWGAVLAWYSLIHLAPSELPAALDALIRPIVPGGALVIGLHAGSDVRHVDEWFDKAVSLDFVMHEQSDIAAAVSAAGLVDVEWYRRGPHDWRGETTERLYVVGRKPG